MSCSCHIISPCGYCENGEYEKVADDIDREIALKFDNVNCAKNWRINNPGKCIYCKKSYKIPPSEGGCYC